jgi:hypothetical protein
MLTKTLTANWAAWIAYWATASLATKALLIFAGLNLLAIVPAALWAQWDERTLREVGVWSKPIKFMAATALFALTTVVLAEISSVKLSASTSFQWIAALIIITSLFEVGYISLQAARGEASHYNTGDRWHAMLFGLMAIAAVVLTATQAWLGLEIWREASSEPKSTLLWGVVLGLVLTFVLSTISGFMLGGKQAPAGVGLPIVGWHLHGDIRPAHFLGVHAQQLIPLMAWAAQQYLGSWALPAWAVGTGLYVAAWGALTWLGLMQ